VKKTTAICKKAFTRFFTHTRPWITRYVFNMMTAMIFSLIITLSMWHLLSHPLVSVMLEQRSLDILLDILSNKNAEDNNLLLTFIIIGMTVLAWLPIQIVWIWLEGGILSSYASEKRLNWKAFFNACSQWFGFMLLLRSLYIVIFVIIITVTAVLVFLMLLLWVPPSWVFLTAGVLLLTILHLCMELFTTAAITTKHKNIFSVSRICLMLVKKIPGPLLIFYILTMSVTTFLLLIQRWVGIAVPMDWWLISLFLFQILVLTRQGLRLFRQSGEVIMVQRLTEGETAC
jgi:hypothetical protein